MLDSYTIATWRKQTDPKLRSLIGKRLRAIKRAKLSNASQLAAGKVLCAEALAAKMANYHARQAAKQADVSLGKQWRSQSTDMTGV
jgi:hypothetical protein